MMFVFRSFVLFGMNKKNRGCCFAPFCVKRNLFTNYLRELRDFNRKDVKENVSVTMAISCANDARKNQSSFIFSLAKIS